MKHKSSINVCVDGDTIFVTSPVLNVAQSVEDFMRTQLYGLAHCQNCRGMTIFGRSITHGTREESNCDMCNPRVHFITLVNTSLKTSYRTRIYSPVNTQNIETIHFLTIPEWVIQALTDGDSSLKSSTWNTPQTGSICHS